MIKLPQSHALVGEISTPIVRSPGTAKVSWWLWANVFSIDAALIAVMWHSLLARAFGVDTGIFIPAALGLSVWVIYVMDHVLDARKPQATSPEPARKAFFRRHIRLMSVLSAIGAMGTITFCLLCLPPSVNATGFGVGILVLLYFGVVHLLPPHVRGQWPREAVVALLFTVGAVMPIWLDLDSRSFPANLLIASLPFFLLCWLNCSCVETLEWEAAGKPFAARPNPAARWLADRRGFCGYSILALSLSLAVIIPLDHLYLQAVLMSSLAVASHPAVVQLFGEKESAIPCILLDVTLCTPLLILLIHLLGSVHPADRMY